MSEYACLLHLPSLFRFQTAPTKVRKLNALRESIAMTRGGHLWMFMCVPAGAGVLLAAYGAVGLSLFAWSWMGAGFIS